MNALLLALLLSTVTVQPEAKKIVVDTAGMLPGQARVFNLEGGVNITVTRVGEQRRIMVERMGVVNHYTVAPEDGQLRVTFSDVTEGVIFSSHRIIVDGVALDGTPGDGVMTIPEPRRSPARYYVCPKDEVMLRVPHGNHSGEFTCPVDGTKMKAAVGRSSSIFLLH